MYQQQLAAALQSTAAGSGARLQHFPSQGFFLTHALLL